MEERTEARIDLDELRNKLRPKRVRFCEAYLANGWNGTAAAACAGYGKTKESSAVTASRLLRDENVQAYLAARAREIYAELGLTPERVAAEMVRLYRRATQAEPVLVWDADKKEYVESGEWQYDAKTAMRALENLGQHAGMFVQKLEVAQTAKGPLEGLSTEELRALIGKCTEKQEGDPHDGR